MNIMKQTSRLAIETEFATTKHFSCVSRKERETFSISGIGSIQNLIKAHFFIYSWMSIAVGILFIAIFPFTSKAENNTPPPIGIVEKLGQTVPLDLDFYDESGNLISLKNVIDKPTIITFVYFKCPGICTPLLTELSRIVDKLDLELGKDYQIVSLSFDHREKPDISAEKKDNYLSSISKHVDPNGWRFFTGDSVAIKKITNAAGFYFKADHDQWIHAGCLIFLSPEGKITRYINGITYLPFDVKMAVIEASNGHVSPTIANILRFCYSYDPASHTYTLNVLRISMGIILVLVAIFVFTFLIFPKFKKNYVQIDL